MRPAAPTAWGLECDKPYSLSHVALRSSRSVPRAAVGEVAARHGPAQPGWCKAAQV